MLKCSFGGQCEITINNRHLCPPCRLKQCLDAGMSSDFLRGPREKKQKTVTQASQLIQTSHQVIILTVVQISSIFLSI